MKDDVSRNFQGEEQELTYKKGGNNMKTKMKKLMKNQKGMTLIELLAVIVIIAIIALIAIPAIGNIINNSKDKAILSDASSILSGAKIAVQDGVCTESTTTAGDYTCGKDQLKDHMENVKAAVGKDLEIEVTKTAGVWTVKYGKFKDIKNEKYKYIDETDKISDDYKVTEDVLNKLMDGKGNKKSTTKD